MQETLGKKKNYWESKRASVQTKKINHQYTKTSSDTEKTQKKKVQAHYQREIDKIDVILAAIDNIVLLERDF